MASEDAFQDAVAFLQKTNTGGESVYDQLAKVVGKILEDRPDGAVDLLEISTLVKKTSYGGEDSFAVAAATPKNTASAVAMKDLYSTPAPVINEETGEPEEMVPPNDYETENVIADASLYEAVGLGLSKSEMYGIMLALRKLGEDPAKKLKTVRFFGKMLGSGGDYYVFESTLQEVPPPPEEDTAAVPSEAPGTGANTYTYFVCSVLGGPFTALPDVTPAMLASSRAIKKYLTGDLTADVSAYPPFPGSEKEYLRCQIGRIGSATVVCPSGFFSLGEDGTTLEKVEEYAPASTEDMLQLTAWGHRYPHIKAQGRCEFYAPPPPEGEEDAPPAEEPEVSPALLSTLDADAGSPSADWGSAAEGEPAWATCSSSSMGSVKYQVAAVKSLVWPGAFAVYSAGSFSNCYVGYGLKNAPFVPTPPPPVSVEYEGLMAESTELPPRPDEPTEEEAPAEE